MRIQSQMAFQDGGLKVSFHGLYKYLLEYIAVLGGNCVQFESRQF